MDKTSTAENTALNSSMMLSSPSHTEFTKGPALSSLCPQGDNKQSNKHSCCIVDFMSFATRRRSLGYLSILVAVGCIASSSAFAGSTLVRTKVLTDGEHTPNKKRGRNNHMKSRIITNNIQQIAGIRLNAESDNVNNEIVRQTLESNNLEKILSYFQSHPTTIASLTQVQIQSIFYAIEVATVESDENTVNKRMLEDTARTIEFRSLDRVRAQMTKMYRLLREEGQLHVFGAVGRSPPSSIISISPYSSPLYPASGSKLISPTLLETITGMEMISLTPKPTNLLLYGGAALAVLEGLTSLYYGINFNLLVFFTILLAVGDQVLVSGAIFETALRMVRPEMSQRITRHEAGHFLCAYLLGCPVEGVVLSTWAALADGRFSGRSTRAVSAGTSYYDIDLSEQISGNKPLTRESIDRYSIIVMGGIAAEAIEYGRADGGAGDEDALVRFLRSLNPRSKNAVSAWTPELIRNQARWGATQAVLLLREYKPCYNALVDALERGGDLGQCIVAIEEAAKTEKKGWLQAPFGIISEEGEFGKWTKFDETNDQSSVAVSAVNGNHGGPEKFSSSTSLDETNGVPTYGKDSLTDTEEFLRKYRDVMEKKLASIDEKLEEMDAKEGKVPPNV